MNTRLPNKNGWRVLLFSSAAAWLMLLAVLLPALPAAGSGAPGLFPASLLQTTPGATVTETASVTATATMTATAVPKEAFYLPLLVDRFEMMAFVEKAYTAVGMGTATSRFYLGEQIQYTVQGYNSTGAPVQVRIEWSQTGPCDAGLLHSETRTIPPGLWTASHLVEAPDCLGRFAATVLVTGSAQAHNLTVRYSVNDRNLSTYSDKPAFDKCNIPTLSQLQRWWDGSPYYSINLYMGGVSRYCDNEELTEDWVSGAADQGWTFIPTWVGPQAPCSRWREKMTANINQAYAQGRSEALAAAAAAEELGLLAHSPIYYDLESYNNANSSMPLSTCRAIVKEFMRGWTAGLWEKEFRSGIYGSPCTSYMADFHSINPPPDDIWHAHWLLPYQFRENVTVWGAACGLTDELWADRQRIRQYSGGHKEAWGGVSMSIDSNIADGDVSVLPRVLQLSTPTATATSTPEDEPPAAVTPESGPAPLPQGGLGQAPVDAPSALFSDGKFGLVTREQGWSLKDGSLLWTEDGGQGWRDLTPAGTGPLAGAFFLTPEQGWAAAVEAPDGALAILRTRDGGERWERALLPETEPVEQLSLGFTDAQNGWVRVKLATSNAFSLGRLYRTQDGGRTWTAYELPGAEGVYFSSALEGWALGGPQDDSLYRTTDGGRTWTPQAAGREAAFALQSLEPAPLSLPPGALQYSFLTPQTGWVEVFEGTCSGDKVPVGVEPPPDAEPFSCQARTRLLFTEDGGRNWVEITP